jgi:Na+/H+ antiporter NhaD/arsenite permease-like protein
MTSLLRVLCGSCLVLFLLSSVALCAEEEPAGAKADSETIEKTAVEKESKPAAEHKDEHEHAGAHGAKGAAGAAVHPNLGQNLYVFTVLPFIALLGCIAICPLFFSHWWEHNKNKGIIVAALSVPLALYLILGVDQAWIHDLFEKIKEYISFMILLGALYIISGGIFVKGSLNGTPLANTCILALGAVIASIIGTTGASVLLIRPLLRANRTRVNKAHIVVLFIFVVSNCGGLLTPLGDPPLFLGFLKGVPFEWTLRLWPQWALVNFLLLAIFNVWDQIVFAKEEKERAGSQLEEVMKHEPIGVQGGLNFLFLTGIVATIYLSGRFSAPWGISEAAMALLALAAYFTTAKENRENNKFTFAPIIEVAVLFIGIFITMAPALQILNSWGKHERGVLGLEFGMTEPWQFFWASGALSSFLDNAPTYLTFAATACGLKGVAVGDGPYLGEFLNLPAASGAVQLLAAVSCGSVFMGANTYIGNGPNFMVKAIAEENGVKMPSFFGYIAYSGMVLIPIFIVVTLIFFISWT